MKKERIRGRRGGYRGKRRKRKKRRKRGGGERERERERGGGGRRSGKIGKRKGRRV